jgi:enterobactin synthetase component D
VNAVTRSLADVVAALGGPGICVVALGPDDPADALDPSEAASVAKAVPARVREFALGRTAARRALVALGIPPTAIPVGPGRGPVWPDGVVGSITHAAGWAVAIVGPADRGGLGVDLERDGAVGDDELVVLTTAAERQRLDAHADPAARATIASVLHGAKECVHKVVHPATRVTLEHSDADVEVFGHPPATTGEWTATLLCVAGELGAGTVLQGSWAVVRPETPPGPALVVCLLVADRWTGAPDSVNISVRR